jgi:hypothetical protein
MWEAGRKIGIIPLAGTIQNVQAIKGAPEIDREFYP